MNNLLNNLLNNFFISGCIFWIVVLSLPLSHLVNFKEKSFNKDVVILSEQSESLGLNFKHDMVLSPDLKKTKEIAHLFPWFESVSSSVSVVDLNNDGWMDIFFPSASSGKSKYFQNIDGTHFKDLSKELGVHKLPWMVRSLFFDCDSDGKKELLVTNRSCPEVYKSDANGQFYLYKKFEPGEHCDFSTAVNVYDFDLDGDLDVVIGNFYHLKMNNSMVSADNGGALTLLENTGACSYKKVEGQLTEVKSSFTHAIGVADLVGRGKNDLWVASDFNEDQVFLQKEKSPFYNALGLGKKKTLSKTGMSSEPVYLQGDKYPNVFVSHIYKPGYLIGGNTLWRYDFQKKTFIDQAMELGVDRCGWAWGSKFLDLNNDSYLDLIVANGFISNSPTSKTAWFRVRSHAQQPKVLASDPQLWPTLKNLNLSGYQRDCVFMNTGKGFRDVAELVGFDNAKGDGRGVAIADFNNDGKLDVVVSNQKQRAQVYLNKTIKAGGWIGFDLKLSDGGSLAHGAHIVVETNTGRKHRRDLRLFNGYSSQSDPRLHFGLGLEKVESVHIVWEGGAVQKVESYKLNSYNSIQQR